jgi:hypothetical protein
VIRNGVHVQSLKSESESRLKNENDKVEETYKSPSGDLSTESSRTMMEFFKFILKVLYFRHGLQPVFQFHVALLCDLSQKMKWTSFFSRDQISCAG